MNKRINLNESEQLSLSVAIRNSIEGLKHQGEFSHLVNLIYIYKKVTGNNYEEANDENGDD